MKTVAVLAALAAVATAVPALPGYGYERYGYGYDRPVHSRLPAHYRREKKSPQELVVNTVPTFEDSPAFESPVADVLQNTEIDAAPDSSARTIGLKKPIIVKKKFGYHLYRDSDEEQAEADPQEKCTKEVKVKLCDAEHLAKSSDFMRSAAEESNEPITENEMKQRIKMAKEAVESLQKITQFKNAQHGPDAELHGDIEVARQALEHIQQNFGNLESMNLQATTLSDAEALQNARFKLAQTDSQRMSQWKEAIENIQKNAEIAKNIEDSFKPPSQTNLEGKKTLNMKASESELTGQDHHEDKEKNQSSHQKSAAHDEPVKKNAFEDMFTSASENKEKNSALVALEDMPRQVKELPLEDMPLKEKESTLEDMPRKGKELALEEMPLKGKESALENMPRKEKESTLEDIPLKGKEAVVNIDDNKKRNHNLEKDLNEHNKQAKTTELETSFDAPAAPAVQKSAVQEDAKNAVLEDDKKIIENINQPKTSENLENTMDLATAQSAPIMSVAAAPVSDSQRSAKHWSHDAEKHTEEKTSWKDTHNQEMKMLAKSNEFNPAMDEKKIAPESKKQFEKSATTFVDTTSLMKNADLNQKQDHIPKNSENKFQEKDAETIKFEENKANGNSMTIEHAPLSPMRSAPLSPMRSASMMTSENNNNQEFQAEAKNWHEDKMSPKTSEIAKNTEIERDAHHHHQIGHVHPGIPHHMEHRPIHHMPGGHHQFHNHHGPRGFGSHGKMAAADSIVEATSKINVNDVNSKAAAEHNMQWKQKEGAARGAYGPGSYGAASALNLAGAAGGPGAVGVFPGANVGGCAIPLLLSCSPSVATGSLAKASYGAHAYRAGENFDGHFPRKRDTKKTNEIQSIKVKRTPTKVIQKIPLEKNL